MSYLKITKTVLMRRIPLGTYLCYPYGCKLETFSPIMEINESVESLLKLCDGTRTRDDVLQQLAKESGEPLEEIADAFDELVEYLIGEGILEWSEEPSFIEPIYSRTRPFSISIDITSACNLRCPFCSVSAGAPREDDLTFDDIAQFVEQVKKFKPTPLAIGGGEPLIKKEMVLYMLEELSSVKEVVVSIFTNGTLITKDYAQQLYNAGLKYARISVDGHTEKVHDASRGKGSFKKTIQGIKHLRELGVHVDTVSVISRINYPYLRKIREFVDQISDTHSITYVYPYGRAAGTDLCLTAEEIFNVKRVNAGLEGLEKIEANIAPQDRCTVGETLYITANGDIFPCVMLRFPEFKVGNLRENDLYEIYKNNSMEDLLRWTVKDIEQCRDCDIRYYCGSGCRAYAYKYGGSFYIPDPLNCRPNKILTQRILDNGEENTRRLLHELVTSTAELG